MRHVDPFLITGPAVISFSGGRTSAYMLWHILQAHGGNLPDDVVTIFANTGREMPATLDFVAQCASRWDATIIWLEYCREDGKPSYRVVSHNSASRAGEPFEALLGAKQALPNPVQRFCTIELKIRTIKRYVRHALGWDHWHSVVGLRADEMRRVERAMLPQRDRWTNVCPLAAAGTTKADVLRFWDQQPFNLQLQGPWEGNCDGCFLKSRAAVMRMMHDYPSQMAWWSTQEAIPRGTNGVNRIFRIDREPYAILATQVATSPRLPFDETMHELGALCDGGCGA